MDRVAREYEQGSGLPAHRIPRINQTLLALDRYISFFQEKIMGVDSGNASKLAWHGIVMCVQVLSHRNWQDTWKIPAPRRASPSSGDYAMREKWHCAFESWRIVALHQA